jgi:hypothetical protein
VVLSQYSSKLVLLGGRESAAQGGEEPDEELKIREPRTDMNDEIPF